MIAGKDSEKNCLGIVILFKIQHKLDLAVTNKTMFHVFFPYRQAEKNL